jgi:hypothetical protein
MVGFAAASPAGISTSSAAEIFGTREFVTTVVDHVVAGKWGCDKGSQLRDLHWHRDSGKDQKGLQHIGGNHDAQGNQSEGSFTGQATFGTHQRGADGGDELAPRRGPVDD